MATEDGLKAQKLLAQGSALGFRTNTKSRPERAKAFNIKAFALSGRLGLFVFFYLFHFLLKSSPIHFAGNGQTEREGNPDAQQSHAARETEGITQWQ